MFAFCTLELCDFLAFYLQIINSGRERERLCFILIHNVTSTVKKKRAREKEEEINIETIKDILFD